MSAAFPIIKKAALDAAVETSDYIQLFIGKYHELLSSDPTGQIQNQFTAEQNILMAFNILDGQVCKGGFIQLIENGYGSYIFDTPLSDYLRDWGASTTADVIDQAAILYYQKKDILEREKTLEEFVKMYQEHLEFEPLDDTFLQIIDRDREIIKDYIQRNLKAFAIVE